MLVDASWSMIFSRLWHSYVTWKVTEISPRKLSFFFSWSWKHYAVDKFSIGFPSSWQDFQKRKRSEDGENGHQDVLSARPGSNIGKSFGQRDISISEGDIVVLRLLLIFCRNFFRTRDFRRSCGRTSSYLAFEEITSTWRDVILEIVQCVLKEWTWRIAEVIKTDEECPFT
jgi:hypothetical protein